MGRKGAVANCGINEVLVFLMALISGTLCSILSKVMMDMNSVGLNGQIQSFSNPLFQTLGMFVGMMIGLLMHYIVVAFKISFPGYDHSKDTSIPSSMWSTLLVPSLFDLVCTVLGMCGLMFVNVSIYQMMRGGAIVFVAVLKEFFLGDKLKRYHWVGIFWNVVSIVLVGATAVLQPAASASTSSNSILGIAMILLAALMGALQYAFEEKVMTMDITAPPLFVIGVEGFWGTIICMFILYPIAYYMPGSDEGSFENPFNTYYMISNSPNLQITMMGFFISIFFYNLFGILVTFLMHSVWRGILDNFRPITVWTVDLWIYYNISASFGEPWTPYSWMQLFGLLVLIYGTVIYNAPNPGSLRLVGGPQSCFVISLLNIPLQNLLKLQRAKIQKQLHSFQRYPHPLFTEMCLSAPKHLYIDKLRVKLQLLILMVD